MQEQINFPKEATGGSHDQLSNTVREDMIKFGQVSPPSQSLDISLYDQDARNQYAPEDMTKLMEGP
jgi:hypothetical protein